MVPSPFMANFRVATYLPRIRSTITPPTGKLNNRRFRSKPYGVIIPPLYAPRSRYVQITDSLGMGTQVYSVTLLLRACRQVLNRNQVGGLFGICEHRSSLFLPRLLFV
jgi:hypothetical protein